ncbi:transposase, partial [Frankia sp. Mgl5]|uniref:transposase n=1 Tax=Frankia sp. Mgl5 TaxID=2933793 RepID=UPI00200F95F7
PAGGSMPGGRGGPRAACWHPRWCRRRSAPGGGGRPPPPGGGGGGPPPRRRPRYLLADRAYDHVKYRRMLAARGITPIIARRGKPHCSGLGTQRWPVERTIAWLHQFRRLRTRWERRVDIHQAFLSLACSIIYLRKLRGSF